jgi:2-hydroxy-4-carboxymuconate semialdehyde hemiacetal dehydrogenase
VLHTVVGRRPDAAAEFAAGYGYRKSAASLDTAIADPEIDIVVIGSPSDQHEAQAIAALEAGKHVLVEIPIAMSFAGAERVVAATARSGRTFGVCHPIRFRRERDALRVRIASGEENIRHIAGRFFIKRLMNVGATGYRRSWIEHTLWHHFCHFVDVGLWLFDRAPIRRVQSHLGALHPATGIPMESSLLIETEDDRTLLVHGSYHATFRNEQRNCARVITDFLATVREGRQPRVSGPSVLPAMRVLQAVQDDWDHRYGAREIPGRPLD